MLNRNIGLSLALGSLGLITGGASYYLHLLNKYSVNKAIKNYGFTRTDQQKAFLDLLQKSGTIPPNQLIKDIYPRRKNGDELANDLLNLVQMTQEKFTLRSGSQERWEIKPTPWMKVDEEKIKNNLKTLGFVDAIKPTDRYADAACILGATRPRMTNRIEYLESLFKNGFKTNNLILLAGERYVTLTIDGSEKELSFLAKKFGLDHWKYLTETHLIQHEYNVSDLSERKLNTHIIDTPARHLPRPTTETTVLELMGWLKKHPNIQSIVFISNQPYTKYQEAIIHLAFKQKGINIKFEVVGSSVSNSSANSLGAQPLIEALGSYLFAALPLVLSKMNLQMTDQSINDKFKELYVKNPLFYQNIPKYFEPQDERNRKWEL